MSKEFQLAEYTPSLASVKAVVLSPSMQYLRNDTFVFENLTTANWALYQFAMPELVAATGDYAGDFPTGYASPGSFRYLVYNQAAGTAFANRVFTGYGGTVNWMGTAESFPLSSSAANAANVGMTGTTINATASGGGGSGVTPQAIALQTTSVSTPNTWSPWVTLTLANTATSLLSLNITTPADGSSGSTASQIQWEVWGVDVNSSASPFKIAGYDLSNPTSDAGNIINGGNVPVGSVISYTQKLTSLVTELKFRHKYVNNSSNVSSTATYQGQIL